MILGINVFFKNINNKSKNIKLREMILNKPKSLVLEIIFCSIVNINDKPLMNFFIEKKKFTSDVLQYFIYILDK